MTFSNNVKRDLEHILNYDLEKELEEIEVEQIIVDLICMIEMQQEEINDLKEFKNQHINNFGEEY